MKKRFEDSLPSGYKEIFVIDGKNKRFFILFNVVSITLGFLLILLFTFITKIKYWEIDSVYLLIFCIWIIVYIVLHELVHGFFYKIFTSRKLTFGFSLTYAYCGVPNLYVYRRYALITTLGPFVVFNIISLVAYFIFKDPSIKYLILVFLSLHISGCVGDLYNSILLLFKYKDQSILINDTGIKQTLYSNK